MKLGYHQPYGWRGAMIHAVPFIHSFIHSILLGFSRNVRSYARLADVADSRRNAKHESIHAAPLHSCKTRAICPQKPAVFLVATIYTRLKAHLDNDPST